MRETVARERFQALTRAGITRMSMLRFAVKTTSHLAAWLIWQATRISVLESQEPPKSAK
jgi:hypothetical protein